MEHTYNHMRELLEESEAKNKHLLVERDQLAARVDQLEGVLYKTDMLGFYETTHDSSSSHKELCSLLSAVRATSNNHAASLLLHDADVLDDAAKKTQPHYRNRFGNLVDGISRNGLCKLDNKLRNQAQEQT